MSRLSVYWPDEDSSSVCVANEPRILPFPTSRVSTIRGNGSVGSPKMDVVTRARVLFSNRQCRDCGYPVVEPVELPDSAINSSGLAIPGTATLVGFRCCGCQNEWSI